MHDHLRSRLSQTDEQWLVELARWYESDWSVAIDGGDPPSVERILDGIAEDRRPELSEVLDTIRRRYEPEYETKEKLRSDNGIAAGGVQPRAANPSQLRPGGNDDFEEFASRVDNSQSRIDERRSRSDLASSDDPSSEIIGPFGLDDTKNNRQSDDSLSRSNDLTKQIASGTQSTDEVIDFRRHIQFPNYRIKKVLGRGGMGVVYLAQQESVDRLVALKVVLGGPHADPQAVKRFQAEAKTVGRFQHENIVRIYESKVHRGVPYIALEYVEGTDLNKRINGAPIPTQEAAQICKSLAEGMHYSHQRGVIHRDLKPANILLTKDGTPKVTDFGLAKEFEEDAGLSRSGTVVGTPAFMAPEQAFGAEDVGPQADVYGLGALLYCMLTGRPPFQSTKATDTLLQVIDHEPVEPIALQPGIPKDLETICLKALQKDRDKRYASALELAEDLQRYLSDEPISARPVNRVEKVQRWCRRNPKIALASGLATALGLLIMIGGPVAAAVIHRQKQDVVAEKIRADQFAETAKENEEQAVNAQEQAVESADAAQVQEKLAIDALKSMVFVVQNRMKGDARLIDVRKDMLKTVQDGLKRMESQGKNVKAQNLLAAAIASRKGDLNLEVGRYAEALENYESCLATFRILDAAGQLPSRELNLSKIHLYMADAARCLGELETADSHYSSAANVRREWLQRAGERVVGPFLADSLTSHGKLLQELGDLDRAKEILEESLGLRQTMHKADPSAEGSFSKVQDTKMALAKAIFHTGEMDDGVSMMTEAADGIARAVTWSRGSRTAIVNSALANAVLGRMFLYQGQIEQANGILDDSQQILRRVVEQMPERLDYREAFDRVLYPYAVSLWMLERRERAGSVFEEIVELRQQFYEIEPDNAARGAALVLALARAGRFGEGMDLAAKVKKSIEGDQAISYHLACGFAQLSCVADDRSVSDPALASDDGTESVVDARDEAFNEQNESEIQSRRMIMQAIDSLQSATRAGFDRQMDLRFDPDLEPIRDNPEFAKFMSRSTS